MLALAALLDGDGMPATVFSTSAAGAYLAPDGAATPAARELAWNALPILERTALLALDRSASPAVVRMSPVIQAAIRAVMPDAMRDRAVRGAADALVEAWPAEPNRPGSPRCSGPAPPACSGTPGTCCWPTAATRCCCAPGRAWSRPG